MTFDRHVNFGERSGTAGDGAGSCAFDAGAWRAGWSEQMQDFLQRERASNSQNNNSLVDSGR